MNDKFQKYKDVLSPQQDKIRLKRKVNETNENIRGLLSPRWPESRRNKTLHTTINRGQEENKILHNFTRPNSIGRYASCYTYMPWHHHTCDAFKQKTKQNRTITRAIMVVARGLQQAEWSHLASTWAKTGRRTLSLHNHYHCHHQAVRQGAQDGGGTLQPGEPRSGRAHRHGHREVLLRLWGHVHGHGHLPRQDWGPGGPWWVMRAHKHWVWVWVFMSWFKVTKRNKRRSLLKTIKYNWSSRFVLMAGVAPRGRWMNCIFDWYNKIILLHQWDAVSPSSE